MKYVLSEEHLMKLNKNKVFEYTNLSPILRLLIRSTKEQWKRIKIWEYLSKDTEEKSTEKNWGQR